MAAPEKYPLDVERFHTTEDLDPMVSDDGDERSCVAFFCLKHPGQAVEVRYYKSLQAVLVTCSVCDDELLYIAVKTQGLIS